MASQAEKLAKVNEDRRISACETARFTFRETSLSCGVLRKIDAYRQAGLCLRLGMFCIEDSPLRCEPLKPVHLKPRLPGRWGSDAGQRFSCIHFNRLIKEYNLNAFYISESGHGAPSLLFQADLEVNYAEVYPGMRSAGNNRPEAAILIL